MWFEELTGFKEHGAAQVRQLLTYEGGYLFSKANGVTLKAGTLETPTLAELKHSLRQTGFTGQTPVQVQEVIADVQQLHANPANEGAYFQVASQFNLLEMVSPTVTPDSGVTDYQFDKTQGPACAIACGAGLIYRNYFVPIAGEIGQTALRQLNMLEAFEPALLSYIDQQHAPQQKTLWQMKNGYALPNQTQLALINTVLSGLSADEVVQLRDSIKIGLQQDTQVTLKGCLHSVNQAYCSAMPVAYSQHHVGLWQPLACLVLQAAYEATLASAALNLANTGNNKVFLTLLGGGAFGNPMDWILQAIDYALAQFQYSGLQVAIVSYGRSHPQVQALVKKYQTQQHTVAIEPA